MEVHCVYVRLLQIVCYNALIFPGGGLSAADRVEYGLLDPTCQPLHMQKRAQTGQAVGSAMVYSKLLARYCMHVRSYNSSRGRPGWDGTAHVL